MDGSLPPVDRAAVAREVAARDWYHTIELAPGLVTPGYFDLRELAAEILPASLAGARCLDIGTFDGFWALEMMRRGAAEVLAIDILDPRQWDWPVDSSDAARQAVGARKGSGDGFALVTRVLEQPIERRELSVYDLDRARTGGFDFIYVGSLLLHLRDPVRAITAVRGVCDGHALFVDAIDPLLTRLRPRLPLATLDGIGRPWWWQPNLAGLARMIESGGFEIEGRPRRVRMKAGKGFPRRLPDPRLLRHRRVRVELRNGYIGDPHGVVMGRPRATTAAAPARA